MATKIVRQPTHAPPPDRFAQSKVYICGQYIETVTSSATPKTTRGGYIRRKSATTYVDTRTGEIREYNAKNHCKPIRSVIFQLNNARRLLYANEPQGEEVCYVTTLQYADPVQSFDKINADLDKYHEKVRQYNESYQYIDMVEFGNNHTLHCHEVQFFSHFPDDIESLSRCWGGKGSVHVDIMDADNYDATVAYLTSYTNYLDDDEFESVDIWNYHTDDYYDYDAETQTRIKHYVKNKRLFYYPLFARNVRFSRKLKKPFIISSMLEYDIDKITNNQQPYFEERIMVYDDNGFNMEFFYRQFLLRTYRGKCVNNYNNVDE